MDVVEQPSKAAEVGLALDGALLPLLSRESRQKLVKLGPTAFPWDQVGDAVTNATDQWRSL